MVNFLLLFLFLLVMVSALFVVNVSNPVHSIFFLVVVFLTGSIFLFFIRNEFLSIIFIMVYVGAILVLFLFVIMMLNVKLIELKTTYISYLPLGLVIFCIFFFEFIYYLRLSNYMVIAEYYVVWLSYSDYNLTNIHIIGFYLYTYYFLLFLFCGLLLFIATIGAILLTYINFNNSYTGVDKKYQKASTQYFVTYEQKLKL
jgi:NADH-quinone oxidoreductase subunit J